MKERLTTWLINAIYCWYESEQRDCDIEDDEWINYACEELGMSRNEYLDIMIG